MGKIKVKFEGIDSWNRPIFKSINSTDRFGSVHDLFNDDATESRVLELVKEEDLCFFGVSFGWEPMGTPCDVKIIRTEPKE